MNRERKGGDGVVARSLEIGLQEYRDAIARMTAEQRQRYRGKVLAILCETGEVIAAEDTVEELKLAVHRSEFCGRPWRLMDGPGDGPPLSVEEFLSLHNEPAPGP